MTDIEIIEKIQREVQDESYFSEIIPTLNEAGLAIAGSNFPLILLPELRKSADVDTASKTIAFTLGGVVTPVAGETITGNTSGATATVTGGLTPTSGTWAGNDAKGTLEVTTQVGEFEDEIITFSGGATADIDGDTTEAVTYVTMPTNYHRNLYNVYSAAQESSDMVIVSNLRTLHELDFDMRETGIVRYLCVEGNTLYYTGIPTTVDTLTLSYYGKPPVVVKGTNNTVTWLPDEFQKPLLVGWTAIEILGHIASDEYKSDKARAAAQARAANLMNGINGYAQGMIGLAEYCRKNGMSVQSTARKRSKHYF